MILKKQITNIIKKERNHNTNKNESGYKKIEDYGIIGNMETCALIAKDGSIDWFCLPHLESPSVFASILDKDKGGFFTIMPKRKFRSRQEYVKNTNILKTIFSTSNGYVTMTDFMPPFKKSNIWHKNQTLIRKIECTKGHMQLITSFQPRFQYAKTKTKFQKTDAGVTAFGDEEKLFLDTHLDMIVEKSGAHSSFTLSQGEEVWFILQYGKRQSYSQKQRNTTLEETEKYWKKWAHKCDETKCPFRGPWHDLVVRSGLVLKLLTHGSTGSIAAAATTSLPEEIGGIRNWDYRFNWLRDSVFTVQALYNMGHFKEARELFNWYKKIYKGVKVSDIQILYGLHGEKITGEEKIKHLSGYKNSKPVRVGNAAANQKQLDIYGEVLNVAYETTRYGEGITTTDWKLLKKIVNHVCKVWIEKDAGIWEVRGKYKHFVYSKLMCWVCIDRGIKIAEKKNFKYPKQKWEKEREKIRQDILKNGYNKKIKSFVQSYNSKYLDATSLLIPIVGFLPFSDYRVQETIETISKKLTRKGLVYRYNGKDGISGGEGTFILCTFWLIDDLILSGNKEKARKLMSNLTSYASPLGLFAEEVDPQKGIMLGNFPQAFSHIGLINSALYFGLARGEKTKGPRPLGFLKNSLALFIK